jgi:hypothetical protein
MKQLFKINCIILLDTLSRGQKWTKKLVPKLSQTDLNAKEALKIKASMLSYLKE